MYSLVNHLRYLCLVFFMLSRLFIATLWPHAATGLTAWLLFVMFNCVSVTLPCGILGQVWYFIVLIPDFCRLSYFKCIFFATISSPYILLLFKHKKVLSLHGGFDPTFTDQFKKDNQPLLKMEHNTHILYYILCDSLYRCL